MNLSHSKLTTILTCPMSYYLNYKQGIKLKTEKPALAIGSAVHWGIEHDTEDLTEYYNTEGSFDQANNYTKDQLLSESMVHGYLKHKDEIFKEILKDLDDPDKSLELFDEIHELSIDAPLPSKKYGEPHNFTGIIDLLLYTNKGFIVIDYKTSSQTPDWDKYLDQIYRYIFLLRYKFPEVPVYKIGIINLKKSMIRQKQNENQESFLKRLKTEYDINDDLVNTHIYLGNELDPQLVNDYIDNLSDMCDTAQMIDENQVWFINYKEANGIYGKSPYWDIFYNTPDCYVLYKIKDTIFDEDEGDIVKYRDCLPIDIMTVKNKNVLNHFDQFKAEILNNPNQSIDSIFSDIKKKYITDDNLLTQYLNTYMYELENEEKSE